MRGTAAVPGSRPAPQLEVGGLREAAWQYRVAGRADVKFKAGKQEARSL